MLGTVITVINVITELLITLIFLRAILHLFVRSANGVAFKLLRVAELVTDPIVQPCKKLCVIISKKFRDSGSEKDYSLVVAFFMVMVGRTALLFVIIKVYELIA